MSSTRRKPSPAEMVGAMTAPTPARRRVMFKVVPVRWNSLDHPRDRDGRFIEVGAHVRMWGGGTGTVIRNVGNDRIEVQRDSDGQHVLMNRGYLTVTKRPDGSAPTEEHHDVVPAPIEAPSPHAVDMGVLNRGGNQPPPDPDKPVHWYVIPCGGEKLDHAAPARDMYIGQGFTHALNAAEQEAAATKRDLGVDSRVLILSAKHGLISPDAIIEPYQQEMAKAGSINADDLLTTAHEVGITYHHEVYGMLPSGKRNPYLPRLQEALAKDDILVHNVYEAAPGIGWQRGVGSSLLRSANDERVSRWASMDVDQELANPDVDWDFIHAQRFQQWQQQQTQ